MSTWTIKSLSFSYSVNDNDASIDVAFQTVYDNIINNLGGTPQEFERIRVGNMMRVTVMYKQNV